MITADLLREIKGLEGNATFDKVESMFNLTRCIRQGSVEMPKFWLNLVKRIPWHVEKE